MKKAILILSVFFLSFLILTGFKGGNGFDIEIGNDYAVATEADKVDTVAARLNTDAAKVASYFKENAVSLIAVSADGGTQIRISRFSDNFSSSVYDTENLTDEQVSEMISLYSSSYDTATVIESGGRKFAKTTGIIKEKDGKVDYTVTQYVTVGGGRTYIITCYNPGQGTSKEIEDIFSTFTVESMTARIDGFETRKNWIIPLIIVACGVIGLSVYGLCKRLFEK
ncbi:MAG: hypothetical protein J5852_06510 [Clostridia bacterium]|nr:hypothetical protein [Clostridia bacterium]